MIHLPYHGAAQQAQPTSIEHMLVHVHYKGRGAQTLRQLLCDAIDEQETEEEKVELEMRTFLSWPFNVAADGGWKEVSGVRREEWGVWWGLRMEEVS